MKKFVLNDTVLNQNEIRIVDMKENRDVKGDNYNTLKDNKVEKIKLKVIIGNCTEFKNAVKG